MKQYELTYLIENLEKPVVIGIIHEKRDIVNRLSERLL